MSLLTVLAGRRFGGGGGGGGYTGPTGTAHYYDASQLSDDVGATVTALPDLVGSSDMTAEGSGNLTVRETGGQKSLEKDTNVTSISAILSDYPQPVTVLFVIAFAAGAANGDFFENRNGTTSRFIMSRSGSGAGRLVLVADPTSAKFITTENFNPTNNQAFSGVAVVNGASSLVRIDDNAAGTGDAGNNGITSAVPFKWGDLGGFGSLIRFCELAIVPRAMTNDEINEWGNDRAAGHWGAAWVDLP